MTVEDLMEICNSLKGTTTDIKWEDHLSFNVGNRIFLLTSPDAVPPTASFKVSEEDFNELTAIQGISQARYFAKRQWVSVDDLNRLSRDEWEKYTGRSYRLVASKLSKKQQGELGLL
jgi:predicted DNA-binding protein (MmcQ/YjbR family)